MMSTTVPAMVPQEPLEQVGNLHGSAATAAVIDRHGLPSDNAMANHGSTTTTGAGAHDPVHGTIAPVPGEAAECSFLTDSSPSPSPGKKKSQPRFSPYGPAGARSASPTPWPAPASKRKVEESNDELDDLREMVQRLDRRTHEQNRQLNKWAKWHQDNAQRMNALEGLVRQGVNEAKAHASLKFNDLHDEIPKILEQLEQRIHGRIVVVENVLGEGCVYLKSLDESQHGKQQTLEGIFRWIEAEISALKAVPKTDPINFQRVLDEAKNMITEGCTTLKNEFEDRFTHLGGAVQQEHAYIEGRLDELGQGITELRVASAGAGAHSAAPRQRPSSTMGSQSFCGAYGSAGASYSCTSTTCRGCPPGISGASVGRPYGPDGGPPGNLPTDCPAGPSTRQVPAGPPAPCHCYHVDKLIGDVDKLVADGRTNVIRLNQQEGQINGLLARDRAPLREPPFSGGLQDSHTGVRGGVGGAPGAANAPSGGPGGGPGHYALSLKLGPLGSLATGRVFDDRLCCQDEFRFNVLPRASHPCTLPMG